jgi:peroxiredoxin
VIFLLLLVRVLLAAVFLVAGLSKVGDLAGSRRALRDFGIPSVLVSPLGVVLPVVELALAVALLPRASAWWGAVGALVLLLAFMVGIGVSVSKGRTPDCHCFGRLHSEPVGWRTVARNAVLVVLAALVVWHGRSDPGASAVAWLGGLTAAQAIGLAAGLVLVCAVAAQGWVILNLLRQHGRLLLRLDALEGASGQGQQAPEVRAPAAGLPVGAVAPAFELPDLGGEPVSLDALRTAGKPVVLLFTDPGCGPCDALLSEVGEWQDAHADRITLAVISRGAVEANQAKATEHRMTTVLLQEGREVASRYQAHATPSAVVVQADGKIASAVAAGADAIRALVLHAVERPGVPALVVHKSNGANRHAPDPASQLGDAAPAIRLPDLDGHTVDLADFHGRDTVVLFWNPGCGFCQRMLPDLKAWEEQRPEGTPELLVISTGSVEDNRAHGIRAPLVLDHGFATGQAFGANGTPMAVLVNADGRRASQLAAGAPPVLALLHGEVQAAA